MYVGERKNSDDNYVRTLQISGKVIALGMACTVCVVSALSALAIVPAGTRAVIFNNFSGIEPLSLTEGTHLIVPFVEHPFLYDVRTQTYTMSAVHNEGDKLGDDSVYALTADGQTVKIDISVRYHVLGDDIYKLHRSIGPSYVDKVIRPESRTVVRNVISSFAVTEVYSTKRQVIQAQLEEQMAKTLLRNYIVLDGLLIRNISFTDAFAQAVEKKQVAMQDAERMKYVLQKEESEKQRKIIEATGEAEAIRRRGQALRENPLLIRYEYVQKVSPNIKAIVTDQKTILGMGLSSITGDDEEQHK